MLGLDTMVNNFPKSGTTEGCKLDLVANDKLTGKWYENR